MSQAEDRSRRVAADGGRRALLIISPEGGSVSRHLANAIEGEFPWLDIRKAANVAEACRRSDSPVCLILVGSAFGENLLETSSALLTAHPSASVALLKENDRTSIEGIERLASSGVLNGILPMNMNIDLWLAALQILLLGGEYYPGNLIRQRLEERRGTPGPAAREEPEAGELANNPFLALTVREAQILELIARGLQNKNVASSLSLSHNTVKIHVHNIIRKLHVHNRTEAASLFLDRKGMRPFQKIDQCKAPPIL